MSFRPFVRRLMSQPGIQLNVVLDATDGAAQDDADQVVAAVARFTRGRIDAPFRVNRGNLLQKTGPAEPMRLSELNQTKLQLFDALNVGAEQAVVMRLTPAGAVKSYASVTIDGGTTLPPVEIG